MRKRLMILALAVLAAALSLVAVSSARGEAQPPPTVCNGDYFGGSLTNVIVPSYDACALFGVHVKGEITVQQNAELRTCGAAINGSVHTTQAYVNMDHSTTVGGSIYLDRPGTMIFEIESCNGDIGQGQYAAYLCPRLVGGSIYVTDGPNSMKEVEIGDCGSMNIHGSVTITDNNLPVTLEESSILGSLTCRNNNPPAEVFDTWVTGPVHGQCFSLAG